jgi:hypothetical protein
MPIQGCLRILKKLEPPVDQSAAAGDVALALASTSETPTNPSTQTTEKTSDTPKVEDPSITQTPTNTRKISTTPEVSQNTTLNLRYLDM